MKPLDRILALLPNARQSQSGWRAHCPAHDDQHPSLMIAEGDDGRVLLHCHAGCSIEAICEALSILPTDLFPASTPSTSTKPSKTLRNERFRRRRHVDSSKNAFPSLDAAIQSLARGVGGRPAGTWTYHDETGAEVFVVVRFDTPSGKTFRPINRSDGAWRIGDPPGKLPLYGLPALADAKRVYVVEGEKCVEAARSIGLVATTSAHGSKAPHRTDWSPSAGREVIVLPDNDESGRQYADKVVEILGKLMPRPIVTVVELPDLGDGEDLFDFLEQRDAAEPETLYKLIEDLVRDASPTIGGVEDTAIPSFEPFPVDVLPEPIRTFVSASSLAIGCDPSFVALPLLAVLAAMIGNTTRIQLKRGWTEPATLWTAVVGESGTLKTPAFKLVMKPLRDLQAKMLQDHEQAMADFERQVVEYDRDLSAWKRKKDGGEPPDKPEFPMPSRLVVSDTTVEALAPILLANPRGVLLARDELAGWLGSFDRYAQGKGSDASHWLSMHGGESLIVDRKTGPNRTIYVPRATVSITGGIQPGTLSRGLVTEHRESGLAARLLLSWPPRMPKRWTEADIDSKLQEDLATIIQRLFELKPRFDDEVEFEPELARLAPDGKEVWIEFYNQHAQEQVDLDGDLSAAWSKLEGYAARLGLIVHLVRWAARDPTLEDVDEVDAVSVGAGVQLSRWFGREAKRVYAMLSETDEQREDRRLIEWIYRKGGQVTVRQCQQGHRTYRSRDAACAALERLVQLGHGYWETPTPGPRGGRPSETFVMHGLPSERRTA